MGHTPEADRDQLRNPAFVGLVQKLDRIAPVVGRLPAAMRGARRGVAQRLPRRAVRPRMCDGRGTWRRRLQAQVLLSSCAWQSPLIRLDTTSGETFNSIRNSRPVSGIHWINDTTIDKNGAAGDPPHKRRREKPQLEDDAGQENRLEDDERRSDRQSEEDRRDEARRQTKPLELRYAGGVGYRLHSTGARTGPDSGAKRNEVK